MARDLFFISRRQFKLMQLIRSIIHMWFHNIIFRGFFFGRDRAGAVIQIHRGATHYGEDLCSDKLKFIYFRKKKFFLLSRTVCK